MNNKLFYISTAALIAASTVFWIYMFQNTPKQVQPDYSDEVITLTMYHSEGCNCCVKWADYLVKHNFKVVRQKVSNLQAFKDEQAVPHQLSSCHTAIVHEYVIEGHVPAEDIRRLLSEKPDAIGLAVPGMPPNSPGMDIPSSQTWHSVLFDAETKTIYNTHP
ncbi:MAG: DUF411 domain-containing protein [Balneolaceae bacterium]